MKRAQPELSSQPARALKEPDVVAPQCRNPGRLHSANPSANDHDPPRTERPAPGEETFFPHLGVDKTGYLRGQARREIPLLASPASDTAAYPIGLSFLRLPRKLWIRD